MVAMQETVLNNAQLDRQRPPRKSFLEALRDKYLDQEEFESKSVIPKDKDIQTEVSLIGFDRVQNFQKQLKFVRSLDLSGHNIQCAGNLENLEGDLDRVTTLDLGNNLLTWVEVLKIIKLMPELQELVLSNNCLAIRTTSLNVIPLKRIKVLTLGCIHNSWQDFVHVLSRIFLSVYELDLWNNSLTVDDMKYVASDLGDHFIKQLHTLKLSHNYLPNFQWLCDLGPISNLTELHISNCRLEVIILNSDLLGRLENLKFLDISSNNIVSWDNISQLNYLQKLESLICHRNPFFSTHKHANLLIIGRLCKLARLNREDFKTDIRRDAEVFYLRTTFTELQSLPETSRHNFSERHPRYHELVQFYGLPEDLIKKPTVDKYINVELCYQDMRITKKLPCDMRVANVQMLCKRLFKLRPSCSLRITCLGNGATNEDELKYELDKDGQTLHFFSVQSGHKLIVEESN